MNKNDKIFVTGHTGLVGSAIVKNLKAQGYTNIITISSADLDLRRQKETEEFFLKEKPDYVFVSAAHVGGIMANNKYPSDFIYDNMMIEFNVIHSSYINNVKKLLFLGSSCIYPGDCPQPIKEEYLLTSSLEKTNEGYALAKISGMKYIEYLNRQFNTNYISIMPTNLYGINDNYHLENSHVIPGLIRKIHEAKINNKKEVILWGTGKPLREFMFADDLADVSIYLMNNYNDNEFINIGTGEEITIKDLTLLIKDVIGYKGNITFNSSYPDGTYRKRLDLSKLESLNYKHKTNLKEGLEITYKDFLKGNYKEK